MGFNCNACPVRHRAACSALSDGEREQLKGARGIDLVDPARLGLEAA